MCCATTDYAMQSVLMQMGLKLLSVDGMVLRSIKHWVHRDASGPGRGGTPPAPLTLLPSSTGAPLLGRFTRQPLDRQFFQQEGQRLLVRLQMVINAEGHQRILPEEAPARVRSTNVRGTKFAMPAPQSGRHAKSNPGRGPAAARRARRRGARQDEVVRRLRPRLRQRGALRADGEGGARGGALQVYGKRNPNDVRSRTKKR